MTFTEPKRWAKWLYLADWWYNNTYQSAIAMTPFQALYGYAPALPILPGHSTSVAAVSDFLDQRTRLLGQLKEHLETARNRMKQFADKHRTERVFAVGDWVYLKLQPYRQTSVAL